MNGFIHPTGGERDHKATVHHGFFSRRQLLMLGAALAVSGCVPRRSGASAGTAYQAPPPTIASTKRLAASGIGWKQVILPCPLSAAVLRPRSKPSPRPITFAHRRLNFGQRLFIPGVSRMGADPLAGILEKRNAVNESLPAAPAVAMSSFAVASGLRRRLAVTIVKCAGSNASPFTTPVNTLAPHGFQTVKFCAASIVITAKAASGRPLAITI